MQKHTINSVYAVFIITIIAASGTYFLVRATNRVSAEIDASSTERQAKSIGIFEN